MLHLAQDYAFYMFKADVVEFDQAIRTDSLWVPEKVIGLSAANFEVWIKKNTLTEPHLVEILGPYCDVSRILKNRRSSAVVLYRDFNRIFAVPFGDGRFALVDHNLEHDFGLMCAASNLSNRAIREIGTVTGNMAPVVTRSRQQGKPNWSTLYLPGLDDFSSSVTFLDTRSQDEAQDTRQRGGVCAYWSGRLDLANIPEVAEKFKNQYFATIDSNETINLGVLHRMPRPSDIVGTCQSEILANLIEGDTDTISIVLPSEVVSEEEIVSYSVVQGGVQTDLAILDWVSIQRALMFDETLSWPKLQRIQILATNLGGEAHVFSLARMLLTQIRVGNREYVLRDGDWWECPSRWMNWIDFKLDAAEVDWNTFNLPVWEDDWDEKQFNIHAGAKLGYCHMDRDIFSAKGPKAKLEGCDLLDPHGSLIHVKEYKDSASVVYLARQAVASAESLAHFEEFREWFLGREGQYFGQTAPIAGRKIVMAIASKENAPLSATIPLVGKLALLEAARSIQGLGFAPVFTRVKKACDSAKQMIREEAA
jgi:uncharacterized protein (TIGR04141 family)